MVLKDLKELIGFTSNRYKLVGAMTGKLLYQSWINKKTDKFDNITVSAIYSSVSIVKYPFEDVVRTVLVISLRGL